jgi:hypothetical protein
MEVMILLSSFSQWQKDAKDNPQFTEGASTHTIYARKNVSYLNGCNSPPTVEMTSIMPNDEHQQNFIIIELC